MLLGRLMTLRSSIVQAWWLTTSDDMSVALRVASGTTQMVCATVCISVGILVWAVGVHTPQAEVYG